jgi:hypothetical protein
MRCGTADGPPISSRGRRTPEVTLYRHDLDEADPDLALAREHAEERGRLFIRDARSRAISSGDV